MMEEFSFNWRDWARAVIKLPVEWGDFYVTNAVVIVLGIAQAFLAPTLAVAPLGFASLMAINAIFFHILPVLVTKGRFSPGLFTAVVLFLPVAWIVWAKAIEDGLVNAQTAAIAILGAALLMAYPIVMLHLRSRPYFRQT
ncbi:HXXEE domain-containing protein [Kaistia sp. UC242_56]|uniref:HXXEE domain-containing protein n=1 Tax=Kaistia sp. UC242_56 TaxID=3374625 RepID=UPI0037B69565